MRSIYEYCCEMAEEYLTVEEYNKTKSYSRRIDEEKLDFTPEQQRIFEIANAKEIKGIITNFVGFFGVGKLDFSNKRHLEVIKGDLLGEYEDIKMHLLVFINVQFDILHDHLIENERFQPEKEEQTADLLTEIDTKIMDLTKKEPSPSFNVNSENILQLVKENNDLKEKLKELEEENQLLKKQMGMMKEKAMELNRFYQNIWDSGK